MVTLLNSLNEILAAAIVVIAVSMLLYNLTRNTRDRVARTSGAVLACVTVSYVADVFLSLNPTTHTAIAAHRFQWIGIAFIPATLFHLSDALLATTGLPSRGRRRTAVRLLYSVGTVFLVLAVFGNLLVYPVVFKGVEGTQTGLRAAPLFVVYLLYFGIATITALVNVDRARLRCQTRATQRRMAYLEFAMLTPVLGIFPFSVLLPIGDEFSLSALALVNLGNIVVILMLAFLAYPLSFFGSRIPDRLVKADLLRFFLRGPAMGFFILAVIVLTRQATQILSLPGDVFMPFAVVGVTLFWQWMVDLALPRLDKWLIYGDEDDEQYTKIQTLSKYLLTRADLTQLLEGILRAVCDYLHVDKAFVALASNGDPELVYKTGNGEVTSDLLREEIETISALFADKSLAPRRWLPNRSSTSTRGYWLLGLYSRRKTDADGTMALIGWMGIEALHEVEPTQQDDDKVLSKLIRRAAQTLDDMLLQAELYAALEGLLPQISTSREDAAAVEFKPGYGGYAGYANDTTRYLPTAAGNLPAGSLPEREHVIEQIQAALRHYYGGPGMSQSRLLELTIVRNALADYDHNPVKALRAVLDRAIENQRPAGEQDYKSQEWLLYNILEMRFIKKRKVREIANKLYMSEANLYRKQSLAIEAVADTLLKWEQESLTAME